MHKHYNYQGKAPSHKFRQMYRLGFQGWLHLFRKHKPNLLQDRRLSWSGCLIGDRSQLVLRLDRLLGLNL